MKKLLLIMLLALATQIQAQWLTTCTPLNPSTVVTTCTNIGDTAVQVSFANLPFPNGLLPNSYTVGLVYTMEDSSTRCSGASISPIHYLNDPTYKICGSSQCADQWYCAIQFGNYSTPTPFATFTVPYNKNIMGCAVWTDGLSHNYRTELTYYAITGYYMTACYTVDIRFAYTAPSKTFTKCNVTAPTTTPPDPLPAKRGKVK